MLRFGKFATSTRLSGRFVDFILPRLLDPSHTIPKLRKALHKTMIIFQSNRIQRKHFVHLAFNWFPIADSKFDRFEQAEAFDQLHQFDRFFHSSRFSANQLRDELGREKLKQFHRRLSRLPQLAAIWRMPNFVWFVRLVVIWISGEHLESFGSVLCKLIHRRHIKRLEGWQWALTTVRLPAYMPPHVCLGNCSD